MREKRKGKRRGRGKEKERRGLDILKNYREIDYEDTES